MKRKPFTKTDTEAAISGLSAENNGPPAEEQALNELFVALYDELRRRARFMKRGDHSFTLNPTALVHEAYLRMGNGFTREAFLTHAACAMRRVLVDAARRRIAQKRGGGDFFVPLGDELPGIAWRAEDMLTLDFALDKLACANPRAAKVVELHYFVGLEFDEISLALGVVPRTVYRDWNFASAWLKREIRAEAVVYDNRLHNGCRT